MMVPSFEMTPQSVRRLELAADVAFNVVVQDLTKPREPDELYDYPVGAVVLDRTGSMKLGQAVSTDIRTGIPENHAEWNALEIARPSRFESRVVVSTLESCQMCQTNATHRLGHMGFIAYVSSRSVSEDAGHVYARPTTDHEDVEGIPSVKLTHPRLQEKGRYLIQEVANRDPKTGITTIDPVALRHLPNEFSRMESKYHFNNPLGQYLQMTSAGITTYPLELPY